MALPAIERLRLFLRPPGRGLYTVSTGGYAKPLLHLLYGTDSATAVQSAWEDSLQRIRRVEAFVLGIPSDTGAGIMRGANLGPIGIRMAYLKKYGPFPKTVLDVGDVIVVPQLLHDEMLSETQIMATRKALYPDSKEELPVSALSIAEHALLALYELNPNAKVFLLGGDHSVSWPAMLYGQTRFGNEFGVLHFDAHTDMMEHRLGVKYCFGTWAYLATKLIKPQHLLQIGIRTSAKPKEHWEANFPITQIWAKEVLGKEKEAIQRVVDHFEKLGVTKIYISNDIDGTDSSFASATGTPEDGGLTPDFVGQLIGRIRQNFDVFGGDIVEVAPPLSGLREFSEEPTSQLGATYLRRVLFD